MVHIDKFDKRFTSNHKHTEELKEHLANTDSIYVKIQSGELDKICQLILDTEYTQFTPLNIDVDRPLIDVLNALIRNTSKRLDRAIEGLYQIPPNTIIDALATDIHQYISIHTKGRLLDYIKEMYAIHEEVFERKLSTYTNFELMTSDAYEPIQLKLIDLYKRYGIYYTPSIPDTNILDSLIYRGIGQVFISPELKAHLDKLNLD